MHVLWFILKVMRSNSILTYFRCRNSSRWPIPVRPMQMAYCLPVFGELRSCRWLRGCGLSWRKNQSSISPEEHGPASVTRCFQTVFVCGYTFSQMPSFLLDTAGGLWGENKFLTQKETGLTIFGIWITFCLWPKETPRSKDQRITFIPSTSCRHQETRMFQSHSGCQQWNLRILREESVVWWTSCSTWNGVGVAFPEVLMSQNYFFIGVLPLWELYYAPAAEAPQPNREVLFRPGDRDSPALHFDLGRIT